jgi:hypothetical protein
MFSRIIFITFLVTLTVLIEAANGQGQGQGTDASSTYVGVGCFAGDSSIMLINGKQKQIGYLKTGDEILSIHHLNIVASEMFLMLDKQPSKQGIDRQLIILSN